MAEILPISYASIMLNAFNAQNYAGIIGASLVSPIIFYHIS